MSKAASALGTLLLALAGAAVCTALHTPIPWMLGPLLATTVASMAGAPTHSVDTLRSGAQWVLGASLGLYFTPEMLRQVAGMGGAIALSVAWALLQGALVGRVLYAWHARRFPEIPPAVMRSTTYYASAVGAASEMTLQAERSGARPDLVAAAHSLRMLIVVIAVPFGVLWLQPTTGLPAGVARPELPAGPLVPGLLGLAAATGLGGWIGQRTNLTNPWFLGPMFVAVLLSALELAPAAVPREGSNVAQLIIGVSLGVRFRPAFLRLAPAWMASVALATGALLTLNAAFAALLAAWTGLPLATAVLATAPGGIAEMSITAKVLGLGVPVVVAFQLCRVVAVLMLADPVHRLSQRLRQAG